MNFLNLFANKNVESVKDCQALIGDTYMFAVIIALLAVVLAFVIANLIKFQGGKNANDHVRRRVWFIVTGVTFAIAFFLYNSLYVSNFISRGPCLSQFKTANILATLTLLGVYAALGVITMLLLRRSKWGSILGKSKK